MYIKKLVNHVTLHHLMRLLINEDFQIFIFAHAFQKSFEYVYDIKQMKIFKKNRNIEKINKIFRIAKNLKRKKTKKVIVTKLKKIKLSILYAAPNNMNYDVIRFSLCFCKFL